MRAVYQPLHSVTHPQRQPFVRPLSFVDGKGPPPFDWYDQFQDHLAAFAHAQIGHSHSLDFDEFTEAWFRAGYLGRMIVMTNTGMTIQPAVPPDEAGIHGAASVLGGLTSLQFAAGGGGFGIDGDFMVMAKVKLTAPQELDSAISLGFTIGSGPRQSVPLCPSFAAGGDSPTWRIVMAPDELSPWELYDTKIPCLPGVWYRLQISRVHGAVRWFVNGQLARINGLEGKYFPFKLTAASKWVELNRTLAGPTGNGFILDSFHMVAQRTLQQ